MKSFAKFVVKHRLAVLVVALLLVVPSVLGMASTRVNYDMLDYLPGSMDTVKGQAELKESFGKGAFSFLVVEGMSSDAVAELREEIAQVEHVDTVLWYTSVADLSLPMEMLPGDIYDAFNTDHSTMMVVLFDTGTSEDATLDSVVEIRKIAGERALVAGMSALVEDLRELSQSEQISYIVIATVLAIVAMMLFLDNWLTPLIFIASIGIAILLNMGSNIIFGEISFVTKALSAVLQLAVTMDYSIFLWHSYEEQRRAGKTAESAMERAIRYTFASVAGSSITTIAGFVALCFMTFTMGLDLGLVMAKGVVIGVIGCVTILPAMVLFFRKPLEKAKHKALLPNMTKFAEIVLRCSPVLLVLFVLAVPPAFISYRQASNEVYYDMADSLPEHMPYAQATRKMREDFNMLATHMVLVSADTDEGEVRKMASEMRAVDGVKYVLGLESLVGERVPMEMLPGEITGVLKNDKWQLMLVGSNYTLASDETGAQVSELNSILKRYDENGLLMGEAPAMQDMIKTTKRDFQVVNVISVVAIFVIIAIAERSLTLPFILIAVIEMAIFVNLGIAHWTGTKLPFIAPICISTIQLGATVDYAILMTTRYKTERISGKDKRKAIQVALVSAIPSIVVSGMGLFVASLGVAIYSDLDMISAICMLLARGALISMGLVMTALPAMLMLCDKIICKTTKEMKQCLEK